MSDELDPSELDPGIRKLVMLLRKHGYETTDSGDGVSNDYADMDFPHVFIASDKYNLLSAADELWDLLFQICDLPPDASVEASYAPSDGQATIGVFNILDIHIKQTN